MEGERIMDHKTTLEFQWLAEWMTKCEESRSYFMNTANEQVSHMKGGKKLILNFIHD